MEIVRTQSLVHRPGHWTSFFYLVSEALYRLVYSIDQEFTADRLSRITYNGEALLRARMQKAENIARMKDPASCVTYGLDITMQTKNRTRRTYTSTADSLELPLTARCQQNDERHLKYWNKLMQSASTTSFRF